MQHRRPISNVIIMRQLPSNRPTDMMHSAAFLHFWLTVGSSIVRTLCKWFFACACLYFGLIFIRSPPGDLGHPVRWDIYSKLHLSANCFQCSFSKPVWFVTIKLFSNYDISYIQVENCLECNFSTRKGKSSLTCGGVTKRAPPKSLHIWLNKNSKNAKSGLHLAYVTRKPVSKTGCTKVTAGNFI